MTPDEVAAGAIAASHVEVDPDAGIAWSTRGGSRRQLGTANQKGYLVCTLHHERCRQQVKVHRLIWIASRGAIPSGYVIDHINRVKHDNRISNLRLADAVMNARNRRSYAGSENPSSRINRHVAESIRRDHRMIGSYSKVAARHSVSRSLVAQIVRGELWATESEGVKS